MPHGANAASKLRLGFGFWTAAVVLIAFLIREYFVLVTVVDNPIRGDIREYVHYAWNLHYHGVFSVAQPQLLPPQPDAYRSPGYPWLIALCMKLRPEGDGWYQAALQMQVLLGTATVWLTMLAGRRWLRDGWSLAAGMLIAVWPHHVAATGTLLSEVAFGFSLAVAFYFLVRAFDHRRIAFVALSAIALGYAYLINPLIALFPPLVAALVHRHIGRAATVLFAALFLAPILLLGLRNAQLGEVDTQQRTGRAAMNFVQGSWPQYHRAWQSLQHGDPVGIAITEEINKEIDLLESAPGRGATALAARLSNEPGYYANWYLWQKPQLLWDWDIRIGPGGVSFLVSENSPLETHPMLRLISNSLKRLNPLVSLLAFLGAAMIVIGAVRGWASAASAALAACILFAYLTAIHTVFQAEPRYATAYRWVEILLVMTALQALLQMGSSFFQPNTGKSPLQLTHSVTTTAPDVTQIVTFISSTPPQP